MNLEDVEQRCFDFLQQSANPMVPVGSLLRHLWQDDAFASLTEKELLEVLRKHALFHVLDAGPSDPRVLEELKAAGIPAGPRVVLKSRIPTKTELAAMMRDQMNTLIRALDSAMREARNAQNYEAQGQLADVLDRAQKLREQLGGLFE